LFPITTVKWRFVEEDVFFGAFETFGFPPVWGIYIIYNKILFYIKNNVGTH
jgi:hypothetical protein